MKTETSDKLESLLKNKWLYIISAITMCGIYFLLACGDIENFDYVATNGTFQNYNFIRRLLNGQTPVVDFTVYLGFGHLYLTGALTALLGGSFAASVLAYNYLSSLYVIAMCYILCGLFFKRNWVYPFVLSLFLRFVPFFRIGGFELSMEDILTGGNSGRGIRGLILPIAVLMYLGITALTDRSAKCTEHNKPYIHVAVISLIAGAAVPFSNDYGIMVWFCSWLMVFAVMLIHFRSFKKLLCCIPIMLVGNVASMFVTATICSHGHPLLWIENNFLTAGYQSWYYNPPEQKVFYLWQLDLSMPFILAFIAFIPCVVMMILKRDDKKEFHKYTLLTFILLSCLGAVTEYRLFGGGGTRNLVAIRCVMVCLIYVMLVYLARMLLLRVKDQISSKSVQTAKKLLLPLVAVVTALSVVFGVTQLFRERTGVYVEALGGKLDMRAEDLQYSIDLTKGGRVFSTYASALEVATGQYQPTGTDYILHCLSDESRDEYMQTFREGDFEYVLTIHEGYNVWGRWARNANWFFHREVYENYHKIGSNTYADHWAPGSDEQSVYTGDISIELVKESEHTYILTVNAAENVTGLADVFIDFKAERNSGTPLMHEYVVGLTSLTLEETDYSLCGWALRPESAEYIPVEIVDGKGSIKISSYPNKDTTMTINSAECDRIFLRDFDYYTEFIEMQKQDDMR